MPVDVATPVEKMSDVEFDQIEYELMGIAFEIHNSQGRLFHENIYKHLFERKCTGDPFKSCQTEVKITVTHKGFRKYYNLDILINRGMILELKTADTLIPRHENQLINYLLLTGLRHGKLINMGSESVEGKQIRTQLTPETRKQFRIVDEGWKPENKETEWFYDKMIDLFNDWGVYLSTELYRQGIAYFLGGKASTKRKVNVTVDSDDIGEQTVNVLNPTTAYEISAVKQQVQHYETHLKRMLTYTEIEEIAWVNMVNENIHFRTIKNDHT